MDLYAENILEHSKNPRHRDPIDHATVQHEEINHSCGDAVSLSLQIEDGTIVAVSWQGSGCAISQAGMSILSEELAGMPVEKAASLRKENIFDLLGVPIGTRRIKCALLCLHTLKNALRKAEGKAPQSWLDTVEIEGE
jgi:nitrogen fixation NifU-like protein